MEKSTMVKDGHAKRAHLHSFSSASSFTSSSRDVSYSCGACGYELNLSSSSRHVPTMGSKYGKSIKRGIISFFMIDETRFMQVEEIQCKPHFSKHSCGLFRRRTKLLCRKCCNYIGNACDSPTSSSLLITDASDSSLANEISRCRKYNIRIRALQPSSSQESGISINN